MDLLPTEILTVIVGYFGGMEFLQFRKTCKRLKDVADHLEATTKPALWRRYLFNDYEIPVLESLEPFIYVEDKNDPLRWKSLYISLRRSSILLKTPLEVKYRIYDHDISQWGTGLTDIHFFNRYLFLSAEDGLVQLVGLEDSSWQWPGCCWFGFNEPHKEKLKTLTLGTRSGPFQLFRKADSTLVFYGVEKLNTDLDRSRWEFEFMPLHSEGEFQPLSIWTNYVLLFVGSKVAGGRLSIANYYNNEEELSVFMNKPVDVPMCASFNNKRIVLLENPHTICMIPVTAEKDGSVFRHSIEGMGLNKLQMIGDFLIVLVGDGTIKTAEFTTDTENRIHLHKWNSLIGTPHGPCTVVYYKYNFVDFDVQGQCFAAVTSEGMICLSHMRSLNHTCLVENLTFPMTLELDVNSYCSRLTIDLTDGFRLAIMEPEGEMSPKRLHVVYVER